MKDVTGQLVWPNSAAANTERVLTSTDTSHNYSDAVVFVHNPSTVTALTVLPRIKWRDSQDVERLAEIDGATFTVAATKTIAKVITGLGVGVIDISVKNVTVLGGAQGFTAEVSVQLP